MVLLAARDKDSSGLVEELMGETLTGRQAGYITMLTGLILEGKLYLPIILSPCYLIPRASRPQPDNREGNESCLAVLNNFYNDGVRFHDVACHHRKPVVCEA